VRGSGSAYAAGHQYGCQEPKQFDGSGFGKNQRDEGNLRLHAVQLEEIRGRLDEETEISWIQRVLCGSE